MSEEDRSRIYAWLCGQMDEQRAEYLMSCLSPTPLAELATRAELADVRAELADLRAATTAGFDRLFALREADRAERAREREADRAEVKGMFKWAVGIVCGIVTAFGTAILVAVLQTGAVA